MKKYLFIAFYIFFHQHSLAQQGCTDPLANNYNASAQINNGSCTYNATNYIPPIKVNPLSDSINETSGLQFAGNYLFTLNDSYNKPQLYRIDSLTNAIEQRIYLKGTINEDWEDIAFDGTYLYIGDFGNNLTGGRRNLKIYKFLLSAIDFNNPADSIEPSQIETIEFIYSNQPQPAMETGYNNTAFDCEAMIVDNDKIHLFSKNWTNNSTTHYVINSTAAGSHIATAAETYSIGYLVTAADKVAGQNIIVLLGYIPSGIGQHYLHILSDYKADSFFTGNKRQINLGDALSMGQAEGLCLRQGKYGYISNEKLVQTVGPINITITPKLKSFDISNFSGNYFTKYYFTGSGNWSNAANWRYGLRPPSALLPGNEIFIEPQEGEECFLDISYTLKPGAKLTVKSEKKFLINNNLLIE